MDLPRGCPTAMAGGDGGARLDRPRLAERIWRRRTLGGRREDPQGRNAADRRTAAADQLRHLDALTGAAQVRDRGTEEALSRPDCAWRNPLVPGLFGAGRR